MPEEIVLSAAVKVTAEIDKPVTTVHVKDGQSITETRRKGVFKGFGKGLHDYIKRGPKSAEVEVDIGTGQFPAGHKFEGKWAARILISPCATKEEAETICDRLKGTVVSALGLNK